ncbi:MAG TPA: ABC transporter permease, partial [Gaiellaceae bacterium]|nr:ABC transporter permease [Gaiellaceae bacterium]
VQIAARDIKVRYRQTALGASWALLQPVATMIVFSIFFGRVAHISSDGAPYWLFSLTGLVPWTFFSSALSLGSDSVVRSASLVSKIYFPRIFIPLGVLVAGLLDLGIALVLLLVCVFADGIAPSPSLLLLPVLVAIMVVASLGITSALSAVNVKYRDVRYALPFVVQLWLFATPIAYPASLIHEPWRTLLAINPMAGVVEGFRWAVLGSGPSPWSMIAVSAGSSLVLLALGLAYFGRAERDFADIV